MWKNRECDDTMLQSRSRSGDVTRSHLQNLDLPVDGDFLLGLVQLHLTALDPGVLSSSTSNQHNDFFHSSALGVSTLQ
jgi:hypothetical protein